MTKDIENFFEIEKEKNSECGILHWSNYKDKLPNVILDKKDTLNISFFSSHLQFRKFYSNLIDLLNYKIQKSKSYSRDASWIFC